MKSRPGPVSLLLLHGALAGFIWYTASGMPPLVAAHFAADGTANGYMPRGIYMVVLLAIVVLVPLLLVIVPEGVAGKDGAKLRIPDREYWLAPERRERTMAFIRSHARWFAAAVTGFLGYVHWLVVLANDRQPPALSNAGLAAGMVVFFLLLAVWLVTLFARFRKRD